MIISKASLLSTCLFISVVGNLVLGGVLLGTRYPTTEIERPMSLEPILRYMKGLPPEKLSPLQALVDPAQSMLQQQVLAVHNQRDIIARMLLAVNIDKPKVEAEFAKYRALTDEMQQTAELTILNAAMLVPFPERERMLEPPPGRGRRAILAPRPKTLTMARPPAAPAKPQETTVKPQATPIPETVKPQATAKPAGQ